MTRLAGVLVVFLALTIVPLAASADGAWLDGPLPMSWTAAGAEVPTAPPLPANRVLDPRCLEQQRPPETDEDRQVVGAGWMLIGDYRGGWGIKTILGVSDFDGMCRPVGFQTFVFADGWFAGTVSPLWMDSRTDGAAVQVTLQGRDRVSVIFVRYADADPLCCPSRTSVATYQIDRSGARPGLVLMSVFTSPTSGS